jgi:hypothetical protein
LAKTNLEITGSNAGALRALDQVGKSMNQTAMQAKGLSGGLGSALSSISGLAGNIPMAAAGGLAIIAGGMATMIKNSIDAADELYAFSQQVGLSTEFLSTFGYAANMSNVETESLNNALIKFSKNLVDAAEGGKETSAAFRSLGISAVDSQGNIIGTEEALMRVADQFQKMPDGAQKTKLALDLFGKSAAPLIPLLNEGSAGINKMREEAQRLGIEVDSNFARTADALNDSMMVLQKKFEGIGMEVAQELAPTLLVLAKYLVEIFTTMEGGVGILDIVGFGFKSLATTFIITSSNLRTLIALISGVFEMMQAFVEGGAGAGAVEIMETWDELKDVWSDAGKSIGETWKSSTDASKDFEEELKRIKAELANEDAAKAAEKLGKEWEKVSGTLSNEMAKKTLPDFQYQIDQIKNKTEELIAKFGQIPGAMQKIKEWAALMRKEILEGMATARESMDAPQISAPKNLETIDTTATDEFYKKRLEQSIEVTDAELANLALLDSRTSDVFGSMTGAMEAFYSLSGNRATAAFELYKAFAIAETTINTYQAAVAAYKSAAEIPLVGPVAAPIAAAAAIAFGIAQVAKITSAGFGGGISGGGASAPNLPSAYSSGGTSGGRSSGEDRVQIIEVHNHFHSMVTDKKVMIDAGDIILESVNNALRRGKTLAIQ